MKKNSKIVVTGTLAAAAYAGLFATVASAQPSGSAGINSASSIHYSALAGNQALGVVYDKAGKHDCKGHNECKGHGGCKTGDNGCKGKNSCKGKGGCGTADDHAE